MCNVNLAKINMTDLDGRAKQFHMLFMLYININGPNGNNSGE